MDHVVRHIGEEEGAFPAQPHGTFEPGIPVRELFELGIRPDDPVETRAEPHDAAQSGRLARPLRRDGGADRE